MDFVSGIICRHAIMSMGNQGFTDILEMPEFEDEMIQYVLSRVHGEFMWLDRPYKITKEAICAIISLPQVGQTPDRRKIPNNEVNKLIGATSTTGRCGLALSEIKLFNLQAW